VTSVALHSLHAPRCRSVAINPFYFLSNFVVYYDFNFAFIIQIRDLFLIPFHLGIWLRALFCDIYCDFMTRFSRYMFINANFVLSSSREMICYLVFPHYWDYVSVMHYFACINSFSGLLPDCIVILSFLF